MLSLDVIRIVERMNLQRIVCLFVCLFVFSFLQAMPHTMGSQPEIVDDTDRNSPHRRRSSYFPFSWELEPRKKPPSCQPLLSVWGAREPEWDLPQ